MIGVSVGHTARSVSDMAPIFKGKIWDFRVNLKLNKPEDFEVAVKTQIEAKPVTDGSDGAKSAGGKFSETVKAITDDGTETIKLTKTDGSTVTTVTTAAGIMT